MILLNLYQFFKSIDIFAVSLIKRGYFNKFIQILFEFFQIIQFIV